MRLYPPVTTEEAIDWLTKQATETYGPEPTEALATDIAAMAKAMASLSAIELDDELEPLFP